MKWWLLCIKKYVTFEGRARRREYWMFVLFNLIFVALTTLLDTLLFGASAAGADLFVAAQAPYLTMLYSLFIFLPSLAVVVRRLHDIGRSGWWLVGYYGLTIVCTILIVIGVTMAVVGKSFGAVLWGGALLALFVAAVWMLVWLCCNSQPGTNEYGPNPKEDAAPSEPSAASGEVSDSPAQRAE